MSEEEQRAAPGSAWTVRLRQPEAGEDEGQAKLVQTKPGEESPDSTGQAARRKARRSDPWKVPQRRDRQRPAARAAGAGKGETVE